MERTVAKRSSEPGWARVFGDCVVLKQCRISCHALCHPSGVRIYFFGAVPGVPPLTGLHRRAILYRPFRGSKFRSPTARNLFFKFRFIGLTATINRAVGHQFTRWAASSHSGSSVPMSQGVYSGGMGDSMAMRRPPMGWLKAKRQACSIRRPGRAFCFCGCA